MKTEEFQETNILSTTPQGADYYIAGIGFSAGGLEPLTRFFDHTPHDSVAYVIIQHLPLDFKSRMAELLSKHSKLKIHEIVNHMRVEPNCVYLMPERKHVTINNGYLYLSEIQRLHPNTAIDIFLDSLAGDFKSKSIAIILSGTGTDGTKGAMAIRKEGGLVMVQDPDTAQYDGMPNSVIESGTAHLVLPPDKMPGAVMNHVRMLSLVEKFTFDVEEEDEEHMVEVLELVRKHTPLDFSNYKRPTIVRRITKRMVQNNTTSLKEYIHLLEKYPTEIETLSKEFMISVTQFFRDPEAFGIIEKVVIPDIVQSKLTVDQLKAWVVGCATGEEAYSLAILIKEFLVAHRIEIEVKIFASDIDKDAIAFASRGRYPHTIAHHVSEDRLRNFFTKDGEFYTVNDDLRKMIIFAHHDITKQPPYAKIDLISCRNMLIYLNPILQKKVLSTLHFCLNLGGYLFLGPSESLGLISRYFSEEDKKSKIYKNIERARSLGNVSHLSTIGIEFHPQVIKQQPHVRTSSSQSDIVMSSETLNAVLEETPFEAGVYINEQFIIIQPLGKYEHFLLPKRFNFNLIELLPEQMAIAIGTAVRKSFDESKGSMIKQINYKDSETLRSVDVMVKPIIKDHKKSAIVLFRDSEDKGISDIEQEKFSLDIHTTRYIADLERKLREAQAELDASLETIQNFHDQAQAYNEELVSSNEEMQSTNEELQSVNEELQTINNEHQAKIKELAELNDDLNNYFRGSVSGQIMVDRNLIIKRFTPATTKQINLIENDLGRSLTNISTNVRFEGMIDDISKVISESIVCEKEIQVKNGNWYQMIIKPYVRQQDNRIDGAIITFNDITSLKQSQEKLIETNAEALIQKNIELTKINQDLDGFIYTASHDLKSPISNIEGLLQAITQNDCYKDKELQPLFEMMEKSVDRLKRTIAELTEISKIQKSIQEDIQEIHLEELIDEVKFSVFNLFNEKNATLNLDLDECPRIKFSTKNLRSILYNLVSNALKYSAPDRKVEISIRSQAFNGYSVLTVQDNGLGIKKSNLMDIFSMFKRFHDHVEGTGIGLYMVKRIVENAGGKIEVESEVDKGTTFRIYLKQN